MIRFANLRFKISASVQLNIHVKAAAEGQTKTTTSRQDRQASRTDARETKRGREAQQQALCNMCVYMLIASQIRIDHSGTGQVIVDDDV